MHGNSSSPVLSTPFDERLTLINVILKAKHFNKWLLFKCLFSQKVKQPTVLSRSWHQLFCFVAQTYKQIWNDVMVIGKVMSSPYCNVPLFTVLSSTYHNDKWEECNYVSNSYLLLASYKSLLLIWRRYRYFQITLILKMEWRI